MAKEKTLIIIKPDGVRKNLIGECLRRFEKRGLKINALRMVKLKESFLKRFYHHLKSEISSKLFKAIISFMCSSPVVITILEGEKAIKKVREICGLTNPQEAKKGTIRGDFSSGDLAKSTKQNKVTRNIIHSSGGEKEAKKEIKMVDKNLN